MKHKNCISSVSQLYEWEKKGRSYLYPECPRITVAMATCGRAAGAGEIYKTIEKELNNNNLNALLIPTGCLGLCSSEPLVTVQMPGRARIYYKKMTEEAAKKLVVSLASGEIFSDKVLGIDTEDDLYINDSKIILGPEVNEFAILNETDFYRRQVKMATRNCGFINPFNIYEYIGRGGYRALAKALAGDPMSVIKEIKNSGLRGRGGAGFPTGVKWEIVKSMQTDQKYVVCNGDEGDPGAYMDRSIMESDPHTVLEGMIIGAFGMGAGKGIIYVRSEYPLAVNTMEHAINEARVLGLVGKNILDSGFDFDVEVVKGAGAFICGEETALIASIEGYSGEPRPRPPYPAQEGLWGKPTCINNVETWANIPLIINRGAKWYAGFGTENSKGTKVFALVGNIKNSGLVEVPMGTSIDEIVYGIGGGTGKGRKLKAVQTGGPSGGCIPASMTDLPVDYESLAKAGTIMGSGGMVVMDERVCMVQVAQYYMSFIMDESCGKCVPCRQGVAELYNKLQCITSGEGKPQDLEIINELSLLIKDASFCGLGQTSTNSVISTITHFRSEYEAHIYDKFCPAGVCQNLFDYQINYEACIDCDLCTEECPSQAVNYVDGTRTIDREKCVKCGFCFESCPQQAVYVAKKGGLPCPK